MQKSRFLCLAFQLWCMVSYETWLGLDAKCNVQLTLPTSNIFSSIKVLQTYKVSTVASPYSIEAGLFGL